MYSAVQEENLTALARLVESYGSHFIPVLIQVKDFAGFKCKNEYPLLVYFRLLVAQIVPDTEERALWMDVDLIVNGSLDEFYYQDFDGNLLAACRDCDVPDRMEQLGCPPGSVYINAGVVLFNVASLRKFKLSDFYSYYMQHEEYIQMQDQDILNGMFAQKIRVWKDNDYNYFAPSGRTLHGFDLCEWKRQVKIVHYIGKHKPWMNTYAHPAGRLWDDYYLLVSNRGKMSSYFYKVIREGIRCIQRWFVFPLRLLHGTFHERLDKGRNRR